MADGVKILSKGEMTAHFEHVAFPNLFRGIRSHFHNVARDAYSPDNPFDHQYLNDIRIRSAEDTGIAPIPTEGGAKTVRPGEPVPADKMGVFAIGDNPNSHSVGNENAPRAVSFRSILDTGDIPSSRAGAYGGGASQSVDWKANDEYTRTVDRAVEHVTERIHQDPDLQKLLEKDSWSLDDRKLWEKRLSQYVSEEFDGVPGLNSYRIQPSSRFERVNDDFTPPLQKYMTADGRAVKLNDLSVDIKNGTGTVEYDCESMSVTEGAVIQRVEDSLLPHAAVEGNFKVASPYYYATGGVLNLSKLQPEYGAHAFIVSSASGGVIEATALNGRSAFYPPRFGYGFEDFASGVAAFEKPDSGLGYAMDRFATKYGAAFNAVRYSNQIEGVASHLTQQVDELTKTPEFQTIKEIASHYDRYEDIPPDALKIINDNVDAILPKIEDIQGAAITLHDSSMAAYQNGYWASSEQDYVARSLMRVRNTLSILPSDTVPFEKPDIELGDQGRIDRDGSSSYADVKDGLTSVVDDLLNKIKEQNPDAFAAVEQANQLPTFHIKF